MAKAKKLPSGNWRTQVYDCTDTEGKGHAMSDKIDETDIVANDHFKKIMQHEMQHKK